MKFNKIHYSCCMISWKSTVLCSNTALQKCQNLRFLGWPNSKLWHLKKAQIRDFLTILIKNCSEFGELYLNLVAPSKQNTWGKTKVGLITDWTNCNILGKSNQLRVMSFLRSEPSLVKMIVKSDARVYLGSWGLTTHQTCSNPLFLVVSNAEA